MAKIINKSQQLRTGAVYPISAYTRVIGFNIILPADANWYYATTPVLGQRIWLLRVKVRHCPRVANTANYSNFEILTGKMRAHTLADIGNWEYVIPNAADGHANITFRIGDGCDEWKETMSKLYVGEARRFGILAQRIGAGADQLQTTILIAEG